MYKWKKLGLLFCPDRNFPWMMSHASNPVPVVISESVVRIYFTCRNTDNQSHIGCVDIDFEKKFSITNLSKLPLISPGSPGMFDDSGTAMGYYLEHGNKKYIYYLGWNLKVTVPWQNSIGVAICDHLGKFIKYSKAPILDRSDEDPFSISYPSVLYENNIFKMWYGSNLTWGKDQAEMSHVIKYAESDNGIHWRRHNHICIPLKHPNEYAISKPYVLVIDNKYRMWYCYRGNANISTYRIGYADSADGINWTRKDHLAGIDVSKNDSWDSEMICYPSIFSFRDKKYMLYNGNAYGKTGFGIAIENGRYE